MDERLYERWLKFLFDRPDTSPEWYWDTNVEDFSASDEQRVVLIGRTFLRSGSDLTKYSETQVANGLEYILNNAVSEMPFLICQKGVAEEIRIEAVLQMKHLYHDCFAKRCNPALGHLNEPGAGPLNMVCYMMWDDSPIRSWKDVVLEVMEDALYISNDACIESALHGLGHRYGQDEERVP